MLRKLLRQDLDPELLDSEQGQSLPRHPFRKDTPRLGYLFRSIPFSLPRGTPLGLRPEGSGSCLIHPAVYIWLTVDCMWLPLASVVSTTRFVPLLAAYSIATPPSPSRSYYFPSCRLRRDLSQLSIRVVSSSTRYNEKNQIYRRLMILSFGGKPAREVTDFEREAKGAGAARAAQKGGRSRGPVQTVRGKRSRATR
jgi:hypothetical protein